MHVSGEITDTVTQKVFSFRGKATVLPEGETTSRFESLKQIQEQSATQKDIVIVKVESTEEKTSSNSIENKMTYHNPWKF